MGDTPSPPPVPPAPKITDPAVEAAKKAESDLAKKRRGFASTILNGGAGVAAPAPIQQKTILGG